MLLIRKRATGKNERESVSCKAFFARRPGARSCEKKRYHLQPTRQVFWATRDEDWLHDFLNKRLKKIVTKQTKQPRQKNARKIVFSNVASPPPSPEPTRLPNLGQLKEVKEKLIHGQRGKKMLENNQNLISLICIITIMCLKLINL